LPPGDGAALAKDVPGANLETIRQSGHLAHEEKPEEVADLILREAVGCGVISAPKPGRIGGEGSRTTP
jgi:magnesium chelatase accessory protein